MIRTLFLLAALLAEPGPELMAAETDEIDMAVQRGELTHLDQKWRIGQAQDNPRAQFDLALQYHLGKGVVRDHVEAFKWFSRAAAKGYPPAQYNLGILCERGQGTLGDYVEAIKWYRLAARQGHVKAQHRLGMKYVEGQGVVHNKIKAHMWFNVSAVGGDEAPINSRADLEKLMTTRQIIEAQKLARECLANNFKGCD